MHVEGSVSIRFTKCGNVAMYTTSRRNRGEQGGLLSPQARGGVLTRGEGYSTVVSARLGHTTSPPVYVSGVYESAVHATAIQALPTHTDRAARSGASFQT